MNLQAKDKKPLILCGAGGHGKVLHALAVAAGYTLIGVCDPKLQATARAEWRGLPILGNDEVLGTYDPDSVGLINAIGHIYGENTRQEFYRKLFEEGFQFPSLIHPSSWVADSAILSAGVQVMAGAIIQPDCVVGTNTIVNTGASIDHDGRIGAHVHIAPGVTICGSVEIGEGTYVGAGSIVVQNIAIGSNSLIRAGSAITNDIPNNGRSPKLKISPELLTSSKLLS